MADNGRFPESELTPIPGGRLCREAAANWLALRAKGGRELGIWISPLGDRSSYRTFGEQEYFWQLYQSGRGNLAARPGTSNHGWGNAVDLAQPATMRRVVDGFGAPYGWRWGEAPSESWHVTYRGGGKADPDDLPEDDHPSLGNGDSGEFVERVQRWLAKHGAEDVQPDGDFGPVTEKAVRRLYRDWGHKPHGKFGDVGWSIIEGKHPWRVLGPEEREALAELFDARRQARRKEGWEKLSAAARKDAVERMGWLVARRKELWRKGRADGWKKEGRHRRYVIIKKATTDGGGPPWSDESSDSRTTPTSSPSPGSTTTPKKSRETRTPRPSRSKETTKTREVLRLGDDGAAVKRLQKALAAAGHEVGADGAFGPQTDRAVRAFQKQRGLAADGIAGPATWEALEQDEPKARAARRPHGGGGKVRLSKRGAAFIAHFEGFKPKLYNDPVGHCTIGCGHLVHHGPINGSEPEEFKAGITRERALELLQEDAESAAGEISTSVKVDLSQPQADALISFAFNVGNGAFRDSTLLKMLNDGDFAAVPAQLDRWTKASGRTLPGLVRRRKAEGALFRDGTYVK
jgi:lysozyme